MFQERPPQPSEPEQPSSISTDDLERLRHDQEVFKHALELERRLMAAFGGGDPKKGMEKWYARGYRELYFDRIDHDPQFAEEVLAEHFVPVMNRLEADVRERDEADRDARQREAMQVRQHLAVQLLSTFNRTANRVPKSVIAVLAAGTALLEVHKAMDKEDEAPAHPVLKEKELRALAPELSVARVRTFLNAMPHGYVDGEVASIGFRDEKIEIDPSYGENLHLHSEAAAIAIGGHGTAGTEILYGAGMKGASIEQMLEHVGVHEIAHANDWRTDRHLTSAERATLRVDVEGRVRAPDRFRSPYVEAIKNKDRDTETEIRAIEYWAEINEAYLNKDQNLPEADAAIVREHIARQDPDFDLNASWEARQAVVQDMETERTSSAYQQMPVLERASVDAWMEWRTDVEVEPGNMQMQQEGRKAYLDAFERIGSNNDHGLHYLFALTDYYAARQQLFEAKTTGNANEARLALQDITESYEDLEAAAEAFRGAAAARKEIDEILDRHRIWIGGTARTMRVNPGEMQTWTEKQRRLWEVSALNWSFPEDIIEDYLETHSFMPPEAQPSEALLEVDETEEAGPVDMSDAWNAEQK